MKAPRDEGRANTPKPTSVVLRGYKAQFPGCDSWSAGSVRYVYVPTGNAARDTLRKRGEPFAVYFREGVKVAEQWAITSQ